MAIAGVILAVIGCIVLFSDSNSSKNTGTITSNGNSLSGDSSSTTSTQQVQTLSVGDTWTIDGQWKLTIDLEDIAFCNILYFYFQFYCQLYCSFYCSLYYLFYYHHVNFYLF